MKALPLSFALLFKKILAIIVFLFLCTLAIIFSTGFSYGQVSFNISKTGFTNADPGDVITYVITYSNTGIQNATNVQITDYLPGSSLYSEDVLDITSSPSGTYNSVTHTITWDQSNISALADLGAGSYQIVVQIKAGTKGDGVSGFVDGYYMPDSTNTLDNYVTIESDEVTTPVSSDTVSTTVYQTCDLTLSDADGVIKSATGTSIYYLMQITNTGNIYDKFSLSEFEYTCPPPDDNLDSLTASIEDLDGNIISSTDWMYPGETYLFYLKLTTPTGSSPGRFSCRDVTGNSFICLGTTAIGNTKTEIVSSPKGPIVTVLKIDDPDPVERGDTITYTIYVFNSNDKYDANNFVITESYDSDLTFVSADPAPSISDSIWELGTLEYGPDSSKTITVKATVNESNSCTGSIVNTVQADFTDGSGVPYTQVFRTITSQIQSFPDVRVTKTATPSPFPAEIGESITYVVSYKNIGSCAATGVIVTDDYDQLYTNVTGVGSGTDDGDKITWNIASLNPGDSGTFSYTVQIDPAASYTPGTTVIPNTAIISCAETESDYNNNFDSEIVLVSILPDLVITKSVNNSEVYIGQQNIYTLSVSNIGDIATTNVLITDTLPAALSFTTASDGGTNSGGIVSWPAIDTLHLGDTITRTITVATTCSYSDSTVINKATVSSDFLDADASNDTVSLSALVKDTISPTALCTDTTVYLDGTGNASINTADINNGSNDNCSLDTMYLDSYTFNCADTGSNTVTLTVEDINGNSSTCTATVTVMDTISPAASCQNVTVYLDGTGNASINTADINNGSNDNCSLDTMYLDSYTFNCADTGSNTVTLTVEDINGNSSTCTATVTVMDTISPAASCQNVTVYLDGTGNASINTADINNGSNDNCSLDTMYLDSYTFNCADTGSNTVTLTVEDINGNSSTCTATVTVMDTISPAASCQNVTVYLDGTGNASINTADINNGSNDNCSLDTMYLDSYTFNCADTGSNTVTLTVEDVNGNSSTCTATVTVMDTISPAASCQNVTVYLDGTGNASINTADINNGSNDNCSLDTMYLDSYTFNCADTGSNTVTLTVEDVNGNSSTCTATVTVMDTISPAASCQNVTVYLDGTGNASINTADINNGSNDNCSLDTMYLDSYTFNCADTGSNTVTLTVEDINGNSSTCTATVTVMDTISPAASCQNVTVYLDGTGNASINTADINNGSNDNCSLDTMYLDSYTFNCADTGSNTVTLTVEDVNGNSSTCTATVTVMDTISPAASCQNVTVYLDGTGNASINTADINNGSNDNCSLDTMYLDSYTFNCADTGSNTVTLTVEDVNGNSSTCTATVTVMDTISPAASCQNVTVYLDGTGNASINTADINNGSNDNCSLDTMYLDSYTFNCADTGSNTVTLTVEDINGNSSTCTATVTVMDTISPAASCQNVTVYLDGTGNASINTADINNGSNDNCSLDTMYLDSYTFNCADTGSNTVTLTVEDINGNSSTCTATVTVMDTISPAASCQNVTVYLDGTGNASINTADINNGSNDNCSLDTMYLDSYTFNCADTGSNTVTLTVEDVNGNSSTCTATVTVMDTISPAASCQNVTVYLDGTGNASINTADINNGSNDNCSLDTMYLDSYTFNCADTGNNTVTLTVEDVNGNSSTCTATVTVMDTISPAASCQNVTVYLDGTGNASINTADINNGSNDNCSLDTMYLDSYTFNCADTGSNTVTLTVEDINGNSSTCTATVTVMDTISPAASCQNVTVYLDGTGNASINTADINNGSNDNCSLDTMYLDSYTFNCADTGSNTVTLTVEDINGNSSTCTATVTVMDTISPAASCQNVTVYLDGTGNASINTADINNGSNDNCSLDTMYLDSYTFNCADTGSNTVTLTVEDINGNSSTCTATVTVMDTISPAASCQNVTVYLDGTGNASINTADINNGSNDNCSLDTMYLDSYTFNCADTGSNTVTLTVEDVNGNSSTCTATVTVMDTISPAASCQNVTVYLDGTGNASINTADINNGSNDNCSLDTMYLDSYTFNCADTGSNTVTLTVEDVNGNSSTCTATVTVMDTISPAASCQNVTVYLDGTGNASINTADINNGSNDNCSLDTMYLDSYTFNCADTGSNTVTLTVEDVNGNSSTCTATVTVMDTISPAASCQNVTVYLDGTGNASINTADINNGSNDNCSLDTMYLDSYTFNCADTGNNTVTLTVEDVNGNSSTCTATVTVMDTISPAASCQNVTVYLDGTGNASINTADINNGSNDNCSLDTMYLDSYTFNCADTGSNTVTLTVEDVNGNSSTCTATVTVMDTISPAASCQNVTVYLDGTGNASINTADINNGSNDNCSLDTMYLDSYTFNCADTGSNTVTLTVEDVNGNSSTCVATVMVLDTIKPVIICPAPSDTTIYVDGNCDYSLADFTVLATVTDNCNSSSTVTTTQSPVAGTIISGEGTTQLITLRADDGNGNIDSCSFTITLKDTILPVISCPAPSDTTIYVDGNCDYSLADFTVLATVTDNCNSTSTVTTTQSPVAGTIISGEGTTQLITLTADDGNGNIDSCSFTITLKDTILPVISCPAPSDTTIYVDGNCDYSLADFTVLATVTDNCNSTSTVTTTQSPVAGTIISGEGTTQLITLRADDGNGNIDSCSFTITLKDTILPVISCPAPSDTTIYVDGNCDYALADFTVLATVTDNCNSTSTVTTTQSPVAGTIISGEGTTQLITLTADDGNGNIDSCSFTITLKDTILPVISCPAPSDTTIYVDGNCDYSLADFTVLATVTDNCNSTSTVTTTQSPVAGTIISGEGTTQLITLTADDGNGNIDSCSFTITLKDTILPVISCPAPSDTTIYVDGNCDYALADFTVLATVTDNCNSSSMVATTQSPVAGTIISGEGTTQLITLTADDGNGNIDSCSFTITLKDTILPVISCPAPADTTIYVDGNCDYALADFTVLATVTDNCNSTSTVTTTQSPVAGTIISGEGTTQLITLTADDGNGNIDSCSFTITLKDTILPVISCPAPADTTIYVDGNCDYSLADFTVLATVTDNCNSTSTVTTTQSPVAGTIISGEGTTQLITLTADDGNGNIDSCSFTITLEDTKAPTVSCKDITLSLDADGLLEIDEQHVVIEASDGCGDVTLDISKTEFDCNDIGRNTVTVTATDESGNTTVCEAVVTVVDDSPPVAECRNITAVIGTGGVARITASDIDDGSYDNCEVELTIDREEFTCEEMGDHSVTLIATDPSENSSTCNATVTVIDDPINSNCCGEVVVYQLLTPNVDNCNDEFIIEDLDCFETNEFIVFNRWEQKVYSKKDYGLDGEWWDGTYMDSNKKVPSGIYFYVLILNGDKDRAKVGFIFIN